LINRRGTGNKQLQHRYHALAAWADYSGILRTGWLTTLAAFCLLTTLHTPTIRNVHWTFGVFNSSVRKLYKAVTKLYIRELDMSLSFAMTRVRK
jgi:hypothetical protein